MSRIRKILNRGDYEAAVSALDTYWRSHADPADIDELIRLVAMVTHYERGNHGDYADSEAITAHVRRPRPRIPDWRFEMLIGDGWAPLVSNLLDRVDRELTKYPDVSITICQIKEKFGGLRFYYQLSENAPKELWEAIAALEREAEDQAWLTCEECGEPGSLRDRSGWFAVRCDRHAAPGSRIARVNRSKVHEDKNDEYE